MFTQEDNRPNADKILEVIKLRTEINLHTKGEILAKYLELSDARCIHRYIRKLRKRGELIAAGEDGYYIASSLKEYTKYIKSSYIHRAYEILLNARDNMKAAYDKHGSQMKLDLFIPECVEEIQEKARI